MYYSWDELAETKTSQPCIEGFAKETQERDALCYPLQWATSTSTERVARAFFWVSRWRFVGWEGGRFRGVHRLRHFEFL